jgi:hypothetical protein
MSVSVDPLEAISGEPYSYADNPLTYGDHLGFFGRGWLAGWHRRWC